MVAVAQPRGADVGTSQAKGACRALPQPIAATSATAVTAAVAAARRARRACRALDISVAVARTAVVVRVLVAAVVLWDSARAGGARAAGGGCGSAGAG